MQLAEPAWGWVYTMQHSPKCLQADRSQKSSARSGGRKREADGRDCKHQTQNPGDPFQKQLSTTTAICQATLGTSWLGSLPVARHTQREELHWRRSSWQAPDAEEVIMRVVLNSWDESLGWKMHSRSRIRLITRNKAYKAQLVTTTAPVKQVKIPKYWNLNSNPDSWDKREVFLLGEKGKTGRTGRRNSYCMLGQVDCRIEIWIWYLSWSKQQKRCPLRLIRCLMWCETVKFCFVK